MDYIVGQSAFALETRCVGNFIFTRHVKTTMTNIMDEIEVSLNNMEKSGKVDVGVLDSVGKLRKSLVASKSRWLREPNTDGFYFYYAVHSTEMILDRMNDRFKNAKVGDNPKITRDSLAVLPSIRRLLDAINTDRISERSIDVVIDRTYDLLTVASRADLREIVDTSRDVDYKDLL